MPLIRPDRTSCCSGCRWPALADLRSRLRRCHQQLRPVPRRVTPNPHSWLRPVQVAARPVPGRLARRRRPAQTRHSRPIRPRRVARCRLALPRRVRHRRPIPRPIRRRHPRSRPRMPARPRACSSRQRSGRLQCTDRRRRNFRRARQKRSCHWPLRSCLVCKGCRRRRSWPCRRRPPRRKRRFRCKVNRPCMRLARVRERTRRFPRRSCRPYTGSNPRTAWAMNCTIR